MLKDHLHIEQTCLLLGRALSSLLTGIEHNPVEFNGSRTSRFKPDDDLCVRRLPTAATSDQGNAFLITDHQRNIAEHVLGRTRGPIVFRDTVSDEHHWSPSRSARR